MSAQTTTLTPAQRTLADASEAASAAAAALLAAEDDIKAAEQAVTELEASLIRGDAVTRPQLDKARSAIEKAKSDVDLKRLQHTAYHAAHSRASDAAAKAHRDVIHE